MTSARPGPAGEITPASRRLARWAAAVSLLPIAVWFAVAALLVPAPAWRAEYRQAAPRGTSFAGVPETEPAGAPGTESTEAADAGVAGAPVAVTPAAVPAPVPVASAPTVTFERQLQHTWDRNAQRVPGDIDARRAVARFETCLVLEQGRAIPFMLVADGVATFLIDGTERLRVASRTLRATRGEVLRLEPGTHHLAVELRPSGWPSIALEASFDGNAPQPIGSGKLAPGVRTRAPEGGPAPCSH